MFDVFIKLAAKKTITAKDLIETINELETVYKAIIPRFENISNLDSICRLLAYTALLDFRSELELGTSEVKENPTADTCKLLLHKTTTESAEAVECLTEFFFTKAAEDYVKEIRGICGAAVEDFSQQGSLFDFESKLQALKRLEAKCLLQSIQMSSLNLEQQVTSFSEFEAFLYPIYADREQAKVIKIIKTLYLPRPGKELREIAVNTYLHPGQEVRRAKIQILQQASEDCWKQVHDIKAIAYASADIVEKYQARKISQKLINLSLFLNAELVNYRKDVLHLTIEDYIKRSQLPFTELDQQERAIIEKIKTVEQKFLQLLGRQLNKIWDWNQDVKHKIILEEIRTEAKVAITKIDIAKGCLTSEEVQQVKEIYHNIALALKQRLVLPIIQECIQYLGEPLTEFSVLGLGSLAREEMTPYSDFEFIILIKEDSLENREYFYYLSVLINFMIMNLGETIVPRDTFDIPFEDVVSPGFQLDLGGKTPLGRLNQNYELIQTPAKMAEYVREEAFMRGRWLPVEMSIYTYIYGSSDLFEEYHKQVEKELNKPVRETTNTVRQIRALRFLRKDADRFDPNLYSFADEGKLLKIKEEIYRLPNTILEGLALYFAVQGTFNSWLRIEILCKSGKMHREGALRLQEVFSIATYLRLSIYQKYNAQNETFSALFSLVSAEQNMQEFLPNATKYNYYKFDSRSIKIFTEVYKILLPLHVAINVFIKNQDELDILRLNKFYDETPYTLGRIASRLCDYEEAKKQFQASIEIAPCDADVWHNLGRILLELREDNELVLRTLNTAWSLLENETMQISLEKIVENSFKKTLILCDISVALGRLGKTELRLQILQSLLKLKIPFGNEITEEVRVLGSKVTEKMQAVILSKLGIALGEAGEFLQSKILLAQVLEIEEKIYGKEHINVAITLGNLAASYSNMGDLLKAKAFFKLSLNNLKRFYGEKHINIVQPIIGLGITYMQLGQYIKAKKLLECGLAIEKGFYSEQHIALVKTIMNLGLVYGYLGNHAEGIQLLHRALEIQKKNNNDDITTADILHNLSSVYGFSGEHNLRVKYMEHVLKIEESFYKGDNIKMIRTFINLSCAYGCLRRLDEAEDILNRALRVQLGVSKELRDQSSVEHLSTIYYLLFNLYLSKDDVARAIAMGEAYLDEITNQEIKNEEKIIIVNYILGSLYHVHYLDLGPVDENSLNSAETYFKQSMKIKPSVSYSTSQSIAASREQMIKSEQKVQDELLRQQEEIQLQYALELSKQDQQANGANNSHT